MTLKEPYTHKLQKTIFSSICRVITNIYHVLAMRHVSINLKELKSEKKEGRTRATT